MTEKKITYAYDFIVPTITKKKQWCEIYTLKIQTMPVVGHKIWILNEEVDVSGLVVESVEHYLTASSQVFTGVIPANQLTKLEIIRLHQILKEMGLKAHSLV